MSTRIGLLLIAVMSFSCGEATTTGKRVTLRTEIVAAPELDQPFTTDTGWTVELQHASLSLGALYFFDGAPAFAMHGRGVRQTLAAILGSSVARAHPGHYVAGTATGQMLMAEEVALSTTPLALSDGEGVTGTYRSARLVFDDASEAAASLRGTASKEGKTVHFVLSASFSDVARSVKQGKVDGCVFEEAKVADSGTITAVVSPHVWLSFVDFVDVAPGTADAPTQVAMGELAQVAFALGAAQLSAYRFSFRADR